MNEYKPTMSVEELADKLIESNPVVKQRCEEWKAQHQADKEKKAQEEAARLEHERKVEAAKQQVIENIVAQGEEHEWFRTQARYEKDQQVTVRHRDMLRELGTRLITVDIPNYIFVTKDTDAIHRGGWIFELCIEQGFTIGDDPYEAYRRSPVFQGK